MSNPLSFFYLRITRLGSNITKYFLGVFLFMAYAQPAFSEDLFGIVISSPNNQFTKYTENFDSIGDLYTATKQTSISKIVGYNQNSAVDIDITLGNSSAKISYAADSTALEFSMPNCDGVSVSYNGISRTANENSLKAHLNNPNISKKIRECSGVGTVTVCLVDCGGDFLGSDDPDADNEKFHAGLTIGYSSTGKLNSSILTLPLSYTHYFEEKGRKLKLSAPISYVDINGSKAYKASLGLIYTKPINERWTIIPAARLGITMSKDLGIAATIASGYLTNRYEFPYRNKHITLANMVGVMTSVDVNIGGYKKPYDLNNQVIKNGIAVEFPQTFNMLGGKTSIQASLANTQYFGDKMLVDNYTDIALSFGTRHKVGNKDNSQDSLQLGFTYTVGNNGHKSGKINFGYEF